MTLTLLAASTVATRAADIFWSGGTASYTNAANWGGTVPGGSDHAINNSGSNNVVQINIGDPDWTVIDLIAGNADNTSGAYVQNGATVKVGNPGGWFRFGVSPGSFGIYTLNGGTLNGVDQIHVGENGNAVLNLNGGTITKSGGQFSISDTATVGASGVMNQSGGIVNSTSEFWVGNNLGTGTFNMSGGSFTNSNWFAVGRFGATGTLIMSGGSITKIGGGNFYVGEGAGVGQFDFSGGTININSEFWLANGGTSVAVQNMNGTAAMTVGNWIAIGRNGGNGTLNLTNGTITRIGGGNFAIGAGGGAVGVLNQYGGAIINTANPGSLTYLAENSGNGTWNLNGGTGTLGILQFCQGGNGNGNLFLNGGLLSVSEVNCGVDGANGTFYFNGGTLQAAGDNANFFHGLGNTYVQAGGAIFDSQGFNVTVAQSLLDLGGGGLTKNGTGTLTLSGANTYTGATIVNAGKLITTTASIGGGNYTVANGAGLVVNVLSANAQVTAPNVTLATSTAASLDFDLGAFGNPTSAPLNVTGTFAVNGTITVNIAAALPQVGQFPLVKFATRIGTGSFVVGTIPVGVVASIVTNVPNSSIDLNITSVNLPRWDGQAGGNWDIGLTTNWINIGTGLPTTYGEGNAVAFDDNALGTTTVNLVTTVNPGSVTANNNSLNYTLTGAGKISGPTSLTKQGAGILTIANSGGNNYTGPTVIAGGTLSVTNLANGGSPSAIGASSANSTNLVFASSGTLSYSGPAITINRAYSAQGGTNSIDTVNNLTLSGLANAGGGEFRKTGSGQLAYTGVGSNSLAGYLIGGSRYRVVAGAVLLDGSAGAQTNYVRNLSLGLNDGANSALILTNTTLDIRNGFTVGDHNNATATLIINNSTLYHRGNGNAFDIGDNNGNPCSGVVIQNASTFNADGEIWVGQTANGVGSYSFSSGTINLHNWLAAGRAGGNGTFNMTGGTFNKDGNGNFVIGTGAGNNGFFSVGTFNHSAGTINSSSEYWLAENTGSEGTNNISGTAVINLSNWMSIGRGGHGVINFSGGTINKTGGGNFIVGDGGNGYFNQTGGTLTSANELWVGQGGSGTGQYDLSGTGSATFNNWVAVGRGGATGVLNMFGGSLAKTGDVGNHFIIGAGGQGTVNQTSGTIINTTSDFWLGENGVGGAWNMSGGTAVLSVVHISQNAGVPGTLNLDGGVFGATEITMGNAAGLGTANLNGGTIKARSSNSTFMHDLAAANVLANGVIVDTDANTIGIAQALLDGGGNGGLTKIGTGTLRLNGANTYAGTTLVNAGTLAGTGTIAGPVSIAAGATLAPGASIGTLTINNTLTLAAGSTNFVEVNSDGGTITNDEVVGLTGVSYSGALVVTNVGASSLVGGTVFKLFTSSSPGSGNFSSVTILPAGSGTFNPATGELTITSSGSLAIKSPVVSGGNLVLAGTGGTPGGGYTWLTSTNVAAPVTTWTTNMTGTFDASGAFSNAIPINGQDAARFFLLRIP